MIKKTISYEDYEGNEVSRTYHFNWDEVELTELELSKPGGIEQWIKDAVSSSDRSGVLRMYKELVSTSVGLLSENGRYIRKTDEIRDEFLGSNAYSALFMEFMKDTDQLSAFFNGLIPKGIKKIMEANELKSGADDKLLSVTNYDPKSYTDDELLSVTDDVFASVAGRNFKDMTREHQLIAFRRLSDKQAVSS